MRNVEAGFDHTYRVITLKRNQSIGEQLLVIAAATAKKSAPPSHVELTAYHDCPYTHKRYADYQRFKS